MTDTERLNALFEPFGPVSVRRMFGGAGIYSDDLCFGIESDGEVYIKVDADTQAAFEAAGSRPFVYMILGKPKSMAFWLLVAEAHDDPDALRRYAALGLDAARRAAAAKAKRGEAKPKRGRA